MLPRSSRPPLVRLSAVGVVLDARAALRDVDLVVGGDGLTVIVGPNGAGKSTLLDVIAGIRSASSGEVIRSTLACAFVPQHTRIPHLLPVTARDVVTIGAWGRAGAWRRLRRHDRAGIDRAMDRTHTVALADRPFDSLSGGQRQRVLLAQALAREADMLLLDEPTAALDAENSRRIRETLRAEADRGVAVVVATHEQAVIDDADLVVRLHSGQIVERRYGASVPAM